MDLLTYIFSSNLSSGAYYWLSILTKILAIIVFALLIIWLVLKIRELIKSNRETKYLMKKLEKADIELKEIDKRRNEFISILTHELKTPVAVVIGNISMLLDGGIGKIDKKAKEILQDSFEGIKRLSDVTTALLQTITIGQEVVKSPMEITLLVKQVVDKFRSKAEEKNISLIYEVPSQLPIPLVAISPSDFSTALSAIIDNAIKFTPKGSVRISIDTRNSHQVGIVVSDTGIGISEKDLPLIFDKFYQVDNSYTREAGGIGMGLYIAKAIANVYGGDIEVESKLGQGSTFRFTLPTARL